jgi:hypothetical protein
VTLIARLVAPTGQVRASSGLTAGSGDCWAEEKRSCSCSTDCHRAVTKEVLVDVGDATSTVQSLWNAVPATVQERLQGPETRRHRPAFRSDPDYDGYAAPLDGFAVRGFSGLACNEQAFHYLLDIERRRSESAQRPFLLMLIEFEGAASGDAHPQQLFPIVCQSLRETDFVGWYLQGTVLGAALTQDSGSTPRAHDIVRNRIVQALHQHLPSHVVSQLHLHFFEALGDDDLRIE